MARTIPLSWIGEYLEGVSSRGKQLLNDPAQFVSEAVLDVVPTELERQEWVRAGRPRSGPYWDKLLGFAFAGMATPKRFSKAKPPAFVKEGGKITPSMAAGVESKLRARIPKEWRDWKYADEFVDVTPPKPAPGKVDPIAQKAYDEAIRRAWERIALEPLPNPWATTSLGDLIEAQRRTNR